MTCVGATDVMDGDTWRLGEGGLSSVLVSAEGSGDCVGN